VTDKFVSKPGETIATQCAYCRHRGTLGYGNYCAAFPGSIPRIIIENRHDHRRTFYDPLSGEPADTGVAGAGSILFSPRDDVSPLALAPLYAELDKLSSDDPPNGRR
jgi:hypothetical protein